MLSKVGQGGMKFKPPKLGIVKPITGTSRVPKSAGSRDTNYVAGFNPRKGRYTMSTGTNPKVDPPPMDSSNAPYKHEVPTGGKFQLEGFDDGT
jgi:hypothetical protein